jgi:hypothetical protein
MKKYLSKFPAVLGIGSSFVSALVFTLTPFWQLAMLAGFIGGLAFRKMRWGSISAFIGVGLAWALYVLARNAMRLMEQIGGIMLGADGQGATVVLLGIMVGSIIGALGGALGSGFRALLTTE